MYLRLLPALLLFACQGPSPSLPNPEKSGFRPQLLAIDNNEACAIGDVNRDGLPDVVAGRMWYAAPDFVPHALRSIAMHGSDYAQNNGEHLYDVNGDGWLDVVATGWGDPWIRWFENPGKVGLESGVLWAEHQLANTEITTSEAGFLVDFDGDDRPEYFMNSWKEDVPFSIWQFDADSAATKPMRSSIIGPRNGHGVGVGDINGDGRLDLLMDEGWYEQPAEQIWGGNWELHRDWLLKDGSCPMQVVDVNGDGRQDVIWGRGHDYGLYWLEQGETVRDSTTWTEHLIDDSWSQVHAMSWADLDGDGQGELLTGKRIKAHSGHDPGSSDPAFLYRYRWSAATKSFDRSVLAEGNIGTGLFIRVADLNQDERLDVVVAGKTGTYILWQE